jgi:DNA-binding transcriptional LysR family regulator
MTPYDLNLRHLMALAEIRRLGSLSRAADAVHLSQPALTQAVGKLEGVLQHRLFDRHRDGITPTPVGLELIDRVERAARELAAAFDECCSEGAAETGLPRQPAGRAMLLRISFTHLRAVIAAVQTGNFILANRDTGISASAIHRAVRDFEQVCGLVLFERRGRSVVPTEAARIIAGAARRAVAEIEAVIADLALRRGQAGGRLTIGAMPLVRAKLLPEAVGEFHRRQPGAVIAIVDGPYSELLARLTAGELDMIVGALRLPNPSPEVVQSPLYKDHFVVVARADHPLTRLPRVDLPALTRYPWIMSGRTAPKRVAWENMFLDMGLAPPPVAVECSSVLAIHALLFEGDWLALLSPEQVTREVANGGLAVLGPPLRGGASMIGITTRAGWKPSALQAGFIDHLTARVEAMKRSGLTA